MGATQSRALSWLTSWVLISLQCEILVENVLYSVQGSYSAATWGEFKEEKEV